MDKKKFPGNIKSNNKGNIKKRDSNFKGQGVRKMNNNTATQKESSDPETKPTCK